MMEVVIVIALGILAVAFAWLNDKIKKYYDRDR
jgi:hypothetical protein